MKLPQLFITPKDEPYTVISKRAWAGLDGEPKGKHPWVWQRIQEIAAVRHSLHEARDFMLYYNYTMRVCALPN